MSSPPLNSVSTACDAPGTRADAYWRLLELARAYFQRHARASNGSRFARIAQVRGTGLGVSFSALIDQLESSCPISLRSPFEGSGRIAGGVYQAPSTDRSIGAGTGGTDAIAKLCWSPMANDLPMHIHAGSDRVIMVLSGRGFFHLSDQERSVFDGQGVTTIAARERDVFAFSRGIVHTFSTFQQPMTLISCQLPHIPFDDPDQYQLPAMIWKASDHLDPSEGKMWLTPGFNPLAR